MSKIICEVCGTSYPDTADQCPICGCVRPGDAETFRQERDDGEGQGTRYTYIKGGRFSKANVKKRNKGHQSAEQRNDLEYETPAQEDKPKSAVGLIIAVLLVLLIVIAAVVYIAVSFFWPAEDRGEVPENTTEATQTEETSDTTQLVIPCQSLTSDRKEIPLGKDDGWLLSVTKEPADTTDELTFISKDVAVVTVDDKGMITPVGPGKTEVVAYCGDQTYTWIVTCEKGTEDETTGETTEETTQEETVSGQEEFRLNRMDITFSYKGESWDLYDGAVSVSEITWTSSDEKIATIEKGIVKAVGNGTTKVYGEYKGEKVSCIIRCSLGEEDEDLGGGGVGEDGGGASADAGSASGSSYICTQFSDSQASDITMKVGESWSFYLKNETGNNLSGTWASGDETVCTIDSNGKITATGSGISYITVTYAGQTYRCIIRVN